LLAASPWLNERLVWLATWGPLFTLVMLSGIHRLSVNRGQARFAVLLALPRSARTAFGGAVSAVIEHKKLEAADDEHQLDQEREDLLRHAIEQSFAEVRAEEEHRANRQPGGGRSRAKQCEAIVDDGPNDVHDQGRAGFGADIGTPNQTVAQEEWRHQRPHAAEQRREESEDRSQSGEASQADALLPA